MHAVTRRRGWAGERAVVNLGLPGVGNADPQDVAQLVFGHGEEVRLSTAETGRRGADVEVRGRVEADVGDRQAVVGKWEWH
jgi:hypothetical protein